MRYITILLVFFVSCKEIRERETNSDKFSIYIDSFNYSLAKIRCLNQCNKPDSAEIMVQKMHEYSRLADYYYFAAYPEKKNKIDAEPVDICNCK